jgi:uncharacterized protein
MEPMDARNVWVLRVGSARRRMAAFVAIALAAAVLAAAFAAGAALSGIHLGSGSTTASQALGRACLYAAVLGPLALWAMLAQQWEHRARFAAAMSATSSAFIGFAIVTTAFACVLLLASTAGDLSAERPPAWPDAATLGGVLFGALLLALQSGAEEWFFRGWLLPVLAARLGISTGLIVVSALFSVAHSVLNGQGVLACVNVFLAGLLFGLLTLRFGNLGAAIAGHWAWNWIEQSLVGLTPNPGADPLGSVFDLKLTGSPLAGAGPDELNGALAVTVVFTIAVGVLGALPSTARDRARRQ